MENTLGLHTNNVAKKITFVNHSSEKGGWGSPSPFLTTVVWASHPPLSLNNLEGICHKVFYKILLF